MNCSLVFFSTQKFLWSSWWNYIYTFHFNQCQYWGVVRRVQNRMRNLTKSKNEILRTSVTWTLGELESSVNWNMSSHISILLSQHKYSLLSIFTSIWSIYFFHSPHVAAPVWLHNPISTRPDALVSNSFTLPFDIFYIPRVGGWSLELVNKFNNMNVLRFRT